MSDRELVEHTATYWAVTDDGQRRERYNGYERATTLVNEQLGVEDKDAWCEHAPEESHPNVDTEADQ